MHVIGSISTMQACAAFEYAGDPEFGRYLPSFPEVVTLEDERRFIEAQLATTWATRPSW